MKNAISITMQFNEIEIYIAMFKKTRFEMYYLSAKELLDDVKFELARLEGSKEKIRLEKRLLQNQKDLANAYAYGWLK